MDHNDIPIQLTETTEVELGWQSGGLSTLMCPNCHDGYLHHNKVEVWERASEDGPGSVTTVSGHSNIKIEPAGERDFYGRRDDVRIYFTCELCPITAHLVIEQHKGNTYMYWGTKAAASEPDTDDFHIQARDIDYD